MQPSGPKGSRGERSEPPARRGTTIRHPTRGCRSSPRPCRRGAFVYCNIPRVRFGSPPAKLPAPSRGARAYLEEEHRRLYLVTRTSSNRTCILIRCLVLYYTPCMLVLPGVTG